jgi:hypothetical protein
MGFRISLGKASCNVNHSMPAGEQKVCEHVLFKLENLKGLSYQQLSSFPEEETEMREIDGKVAAFSTYKEILNEEKILVVVQAFYPTWRFPNYFSLNSIGKLFAEALVITKSGQFEEAPENLLYKYR